MSTYDSDAYLVLEGVLILYTGTPTENIVIPSVINNQTITRIGSGAFRDCWKIKSITIPDTVTSIENCAFGGCEILTEINLPVFSNQLHIDKDAFQGCTNIQRILTTMTEKQYQDINASGHKLEDDSVIVLDNSNLKMILGSMGDYIQKVPIESRMVFCIKSNDEKVLEDTLFVYGREGKITISEDEAFMNHIKKGYTSDVSSEDDILMDWYARADKEANYNRTSLAYYKLDETTRLEGKVRIKLYVSEGFHLVQSAVKVAYNGESYYVYRRHYLSSNDKEPLLRFDMAIYNEDGLIEKGEVVGEVYAKYRLLSLL